MELLERYLSEVRKHLPIKDRDDTIKELRSLVLEEFDSRSNEINNEDLLYMIIKEYGNPIEVAARYRNTNPLISAEVRPYYYMVLKIVFMAVPFGILVSTIVRFIDDNNSFKLIDLLLEMAYSIPSIINGLMVGFAFISLIFILIEKYAKDELRKEIPVFDPKDLPAVPKDIFKISIFEHLFSTLMLVLFLYLLNYTEGLITITLDDINYPLLNETFSKMLPFINFSLFFALGISIIELTKQRKFPLSIILDFIQTVYSGILLLVIASNEIFTDAVIEGYDLGILPNMFRVMMYIGGAVTIIGGIIGFIKSKNKISK